MQKYEKQQPLPTFRPMSPISANAELLLYHINREEILHATAVKFTTSP